MLQHGGIFFAMQIFALDEKCKVYYNYFSNTYIFVCEAAKRSRQFELYFAST